MQNKLIALSLASLVALSALFYGSPRAWAAIAFVNHSEQYDGGTSALTHSTPATSLTAGNLMVVCVRQGGSNNIPSSVTDTALNNYVEIPNARASAGSGEQFSMWYAMNTAGNASNIVTVHWAVAEPWVGVWTRQYSGVKTTAALDISTSAANGSAAASITSPQFTTTNANEVIVACNSDLGEANTLTAGTIGGVAATNFYTSGAAGSQVFAGEDRIVSSILTNATASMNTSPNELAEMGVASFIAASTPAGPAFTLPRLTFLRGILTLVRGSLILR